MLSPGKKVPDTFNSLFNSPPDHARVNTQQSLDLVPVLCLDCGENVLERIVHAIRQPCASAARLVRVRVQLLVRHSIWRFYWLESHRVEIKQFRLISQPG